MKPVKTYPKYKCDFCKKKAVHHAMLKHEVVCWYNPNRKCRTCFGEGTVFYYNGFTEVESDCPDCERAKEIADRKKSEVNNLI